MLDTRLKVDVNKMKRPYIKKERINWDYLYDIVRKQYGNIGDFQFNVLHKDHSYFNKCKKGVLSFGVNEAETIVKTLKVNQTALFPELAEMTEVPETVGNLDLQRIADSAIVEEPFDVTELESDFEKSVRQRLDDIETKLDMVLELEDKINLIHLNLMNLMEKMPKDDPAAKAEEILREFAKARGRGGRACEFKLFQEELDRRNVGRSYARDAINRVGAELEATGYGKDKTMWVIMPEVQDA